jgi:hypothetical protein
MRWFAFFLMMLPTLEARNSLTRREHKEGYHLLFNGRSLANFHTVKQRGDAGRWIVRKGILTWDRGGTWLATDETYYDFVLRLEYRTGAESNSGIFLRAAPEGNPAFTGMELQILSDHGAPPGVHSSGALYGAIAPAKNAARRDGEWNRVEVAVIGRKITALLNGERVIDADLDDPAYEKAQEKPLAARVRHGHVGLQAYSTGAPVEFRRIRIRVLKTGPKFPPLKPDDEKN